MGAGFCPAKPKTECDALGIDRVLRSWAWVIWRACGVRRKQWWWWWDARSTRLSGSGGSDRKKTDIERACSILPAHQKFRMQHVGGVQGVGWILNLSARLVVNTRTSGAGHLACKTENRAARARFWSGVSKKRGGLWRRSMGRNRYDG